MLKIVLLFVAVVSIGGCSTDGAKKNMEFQLSRDVGKLPGDAFRNILAIECKDRNGEAGCLRVDTYYDCRIWYTLDKQTGRISGWEYASRPENCWGYHGN